MGFFLNKCDVMQYLNDKGINPANLGYGYLVTAITLAAGDEDYLHKMIALYQQVAQLKRSTSVRVERAIRFSIRTSGCKDANRLFIARAVNYFELKEARIAKKNASKKNYVWSSKQPH